MTKKCSLLPVHGGRKGTEGWTGDRAPGFLLPLLPQAHPKPLWEGEAWKALETRIGVKHLDPGASNWLPHWEAVLQTATWASLQSHLVTLSINSGRWRGPLRALFTFTKITPEFCPFCFSELFSNSGVLTMEVF